jgi:hypothetical protein|tara:strand:- start:178 stop:621 length:444 start_codon:yes stop_codon:yes gene_type:complete
MKIKHVTAQIISIGFLSILSLFSHASATDACENVSKVTTNVATSTCFQYVKGFLDGALLSDAQIMENISKDDKGTTFSDRAFSTRVGKSRGVVPDTFLADFCLPKSTASDDVVMKVLEALKKVKVKNDISADMIFENVKREFPCSRS